MRKKMAITKNVVALQSAYNELLNRDSGIPGLGLLHGNTGHGKSTAVAWLVNKVNGIYVRAAATWTPSAMLGAIMSELGAEALGNNSALMVKRITEQLAINNRLLVVDEADYLFSNLKMLETLRDIHDVSGAPVIIVGMEGIERRIVNRPQFRRRISQWVEFRSADLEDARTLTNDVCEVEVEDDLLARLHEEAAGNVGLMVVGLSRIESLGRANGWKKLDSERWGNRKFFVTSGPKRSVA